jgi:hypothetical protein
MALGEARKMLFVLEHTMAESLGYFWIVRVRLVYPRLLSGNKFVEALVRSRVEETNLRRNVAALPRMERVESLRILALQEAHCRRLTDPLPIPRSHPSSSHQPLLQSVISVA